MVFYVSQTLTLSVKFVPILTVTSLSLAVRSASLFMDNSRKKRKDKKNQEEVVSFDGVQQLLVSGNKGVSDHSAYTSKAVVDSGCLALPTDVATSVGSVSGQ